MCQHWISTEFLDRKLDTYENALKMGIYQDWLLCHPTSFLISYFNYVIPICFFRPEQLVLLFRRTSESNCPNIASERASGGFFSKDLAPGFTGPDGWFRVQMGPGLGASRRTTDQRFLQRDFEHADSYYMLLCLCPIFVDKHHRKYEEFICVFESLGIRTSRGSSEKYPAREFMDRAVHDFRQNPLQLSH